MARRRTRWPLLIAALLLAGGGVLLLSKPELLAPFATRLINRQLAHHDGHLRIGAYRLRPMVGLDAIDVTFTLRGGEGGLTLVAVDTLELDFRLREVLGRVTRLQRVAALGLEVYHHERSDPAEPGTGGGFGWPELALEQVKIRDGRIEISRSDGRLRERIDALNWLGTATFGEQGAQLVSYSGGMVWHTRNAVFDGIYGTVTLDEDGLVAEGLSAAWNDGHGRVTGRLVGDGIALSASGRNIDVEALNDLTGLGLDIAAHGDITCTVAVRADTVFFAADFTGRFEEWDLTEMRGEAVITDEVVFFDVLRGQVGGSRFDGSLRAEVLGDERAVITIEGEAREVDLREGLIPATADLPHTGGRGRLHIVHDTADESTRVRGLLLDGFVEIMPFDSCRVDVWAQGDSLHLRSIDLVHGSVRAQLAGTSDRDEVFDGWLQLAIADLADLPAGWGWPDLHGKASGRASLQGRISALGLAGTVNLASASGPAVRVRGGEVSLVGERVLGDDWALSAVVAGDGFHLGDVPLGSYLSWLRLDAATVAVDSFVTVRGDTTLSLSGRADLLPDRTDLAVDRFHLALGGSDWRSEKPFTAAVGPGLFQLPAVHLVSAQGELLATADYRRDTAMLDGRLDLTNVNLDVLDAVIDWPQRTGGMVTAVLEVGGRPDAPAIGLSGRLLGAEFPLARIDSLDVSALLRGGRVRLDSLTLGCNWGRVDARGTLAHPDVDLRDFWPGAALDLKVRVTDGDWAFLEQFELEALDRLGGIFQGDLRVIGTTREPLVTGSLHSAPFRFQWLRLEELTGTLRADAAQLALGDLRGRHGAMQLEGRVEVPLRFDLLSEPVTPEDGPFYAYLRVPAGTDLAPLMHATDAFTRFGGRGEAELTIAGPLVRPRYQGRLALNDLEVVLRDTEEIFREGSVRGTFSDDVLVLEEVRGRTGLRGTFAGAGLVTFAGLELETWDITFVADRLLVASIPDLRALVRTRNGRLTGVPVGPDRKLVPRFTGDYELIRGRYTGSFGGQAGAQDPTLGTVAPDWLADLRISGPPRSLRIVNRTMELDLSGDVSLVRDADGMALSGTMDGDTGRLPVFNNTFRVVRGRFDFSREVGVVPMVDIDAETRVRLPSQVAGFSVVERLTVHATGPADAMSIRYSSESGYPREAIERMLLGLAPYPDEQGDQSAFTSASIGAGLNLIEREIAREIGIFDTFEIDQIQRQQLGTTGLDPLIGVGKYLGRDLYIKYAQGLNQNDHDLLIEYQINNRLLLQTEIRRRIDEYQGDATYNLDLKYRFDY